MSPMLTGHGRPFAFRSIRVTLDFEGIVKKSRKIRLFRTSGPNRFACCSRPDTIPAPLRSQGDRHGAWRSLVEHLLWEQRVGGSNPSAPTNSGDMGNT